MPELQLAFDAKDDSLSVRRFAVHEAMSSLFSVSVWARSPHDDLDLELFVGKGAAFRVVHGMRFAQAPERTWSGVVSHMELVQAEPTGLSTYYLRLVPRLWLATQRRSHRLFQHVSIPDIVDTLLGEWHVDHAWRVHRPAYPKLDMRVQYGESDFDFLSRLLEEAGISYAFHADEAHPERGSELVLYDAPHASAPREGGPIPFNQSPKRSAELEFVTAVRLAQQVRTGRVTLRDHDFRQHPTFKLHGRTPAAGSAEEMLEHYAYTPGAFLVEIEEELGRLADKRVRGAVDEKVAHFVGGKAGEVLGEVADRVAGAIGKLFGDDKGKARHSEKAGAERAQKLLESARAHRRSVTFETNAIDLAPGTVFSMGGHGHRDLGGETKLLVTEFSLEGAPGDEWSMSAHAAFAELPHRPPMKTPKPSVQGLQSAVVVGPPGEEIHTDEHGRVRVQFHWDREGGFDDKSSCWMRVSQGWAGHGFGMIAIPRVGQEVLVAFLEGDPDHPVVVGRLYNATSRVPWDLPTHRTRSGWRTDSSPGSGGYNEVMFEDAKGHELVRVQAERDLETVVKRSDTVTMHHITGVLRDQDGKVLPNWTVVVKGSDGAVQQVQTDGSGKYFALVPPGECEVSLPGGKRYGREGVGLDHMDEEAEVFQDGGPAT